MIGRFFKAITNFNRSMFLGMFDGMEAYFLDTRTSKYIPFYRKKEVFNIGKGDVQKTYSIIPSYIVNKTSYYVSDCSEPIKTEIKPIELKKDWLRCEWWCDSKNFSTTYNNKLTRSFLLTNEKNMLKIVIILLIAIFLNQILLSNGMNVFDIGNFAGK